MAEVVDFLSDLALVDDELSELLVDDELSDFLSVLVSDELLELVSLLDDVDEDVDELELPERLSFL